MTTQRRIPPPGHYVARRPMHPATATVTAPNHRLRRFLQISAALIGPLALAGLLGVPTILLAFITVLWGLVVYGFAAA
jgi:uncharacterized membrane protein YdbT with pleckstrin-like domain